MPSSTDFFVNNSIYDFHVYWSLLDTRDWGYPSQPEIQPGADCVFMAERLLEMAYRVLQIPRPLYCFHFVGAEPLLHPGITRLAGYILSAGRPARVAVNTGGGLEIDKYRQLLTGQPQNSLEIKICAHSGQVALKDLLVLVSVIHGEGQSAEVNVISDNAREAQTIIDCLLKLNSSLGMDARIRLDNREIITRQALSTQSLKNVQTAGLAGSRDGECRPDSRILAQPRGCWCVQGINYLQILPDGTFRGAPCPHTLAGRPLWQEDNDPAINLVCCDENTCPEISCHVPRFRQKPDAIACMEEFGSMATSWNYAYPFLKNPFDQSMTPVQKVISILSSMKPGAGSEKIPGFSPNPALALERIADVAAVYSAMGDAESQEAFLAGVKLLMEGESGYFRHGLAEEKLKKIIGEEKTATPYYGPGRYCDLYSPAGPVSLAEMTARRGTLRQYLPRLAIPLVFETFLDIPLWIKKNFPSYVFYLGNWAQPAHRRGEPSILLHAIAPGNIRQAAPVSWTPEPLEVTDDLRVEVEKTLASLPKLRLTAGDFDPESVSIVIFSDYFEEAATYYQVRYAGRMPVFLLADWAECDLETLRQRSADQGITIRPFQDINARHPESYCLFISCDPTALEKKPHWKVFHAAMEAGLTSGYLMDGVHHFWLLQPYPDYICERFDDICRIWASLVDGESREMWLRIVKRLQTGDLGYLQSSPFPQYGHPEVLPASGSVVFEGGLADGESTLQLAKLVGEKGRVIGFEPDETGYHQAREKCSGVANVTIEKLGLWSSERSLFIEAQGARSKVGESHTEGLGECRVIDLDSYVVKMNLPCDCIKLDIEGAEPECLEGARRLIGRDHPDLMISIYHQINQLIDIPLWVLENFPGYELRLGHHSSWTAETVLYARWYGRNALKKDSAIVIAGNAPDLEKVINQALSMESEDREILAVFPAGDAACANVVCAFRDQYPGIIRSVEYDNTPQVAINQAMYMASGEFMAIFRPQDAPDPRFFRNGKAIMRALDADMAVTGVAWQGKTLNYWPDNAGTGDVATARDLMAGGLPFNGRNRLFRTSFLRQNNIKFPDNQAFADEIVNVQASIYAGKIITLPRVMIWQYDSSENKTSAPDFFRDFAAYVNWLENFFEDTETASEDFLQEYQERIYKRYKDILLDVIGRYLERPEKILSGANLRNLSTSPWLMTRFLRDYAREHVRLKKKFIEVEAEDLDFRSAAARSKPPIVCSTYGKADDAVARAPVLSVIMPNYNKEDYLEKCLESILGQTFRDFELIIVDDASTDKSYHILRLQADLDSRIRLYRLDYNVRQGICRNIALAKARGEYVIFVDSDDICRQGYFLEAVETIRSSNADIAIFSSRIIDTAGNITWENRLPNAILNHRQGIDEFFKDRFICAVWAKIYRRKIIALAHCQFAEFVYHQDVPFLYKYLMNSNRILTSSSLAYTSNLSCNSTLRPASAKYLHVFSALELYDFKYRAWRENYGDLLFEKGDIWPTANILWNIENIFLEKCQAWQAEIGELPVTDQELDRLAKNLLFWANLLYGFARLYANNKDLAEYAPSSMSVREIENPILSVIIPVYNQESNIRICLGSILAQSMPYYEIIIVDDCSTDNTLVVCEAFAERDKRISVHKLGKNGGQGIARNYGMERATGKYVTFIDSDDYILPEFFLRGIVLMENNPELDFVNFAKIDEKNAEAARVDTEQSRLVNGLEMLELVCSGQSNCHEPWAKIIRRDFLQKNRITFPEHLFEDNIYLLNLFARATKIYLNSELAYVYKKAPSEVSTVNPLKYTRRHVCGHFKLFAGMSEFFRNNREFCPSRKLAFKRMENRFRFDRQTGLFPYLASFGEGCSPLSREDIANLRKAPEFVKLILRDYAALAVKNSNAAPSVWPHPLAKKAPVKSPELVYASFAGARTADISLIFHNGGALASALALLEDIGAGNQEMIVEIIAYAPERESFYKSVAIPASKKVLFSFYETTAPETEVARHAAEKARGEFVIFADRPVAINLCRLARAFEFVDKNNLQHGLFDEDAGEFRLTDNGVGTFLAILNDAKQPPLPLYRKAYMAIKGHESMFGFALAQIASKSHLAILPQCLKTGDGNYPADSSDLAVGYHAAIHCFADAGKVLQASADYEKRFVDWQMNARTGNFRQILSYIAANKHIAIDELVSDDDINRLSWSGIFLERLILDFANRLAK